MCKTNEPEQTSAQQQAPASLDAEVRKAEIQLRVAELQSTAEYNRSPAGLMQRQFETFQRLAKPLSESNFVPAAYKGNLGDCVIAVEIACRLNVFPLTVMQNLCVVKGNPTWKSKFLIACVNTCGRYTTLDYKVKIDGKVGPVPAKVWERGADGKNHEVLRPFAQPDLDNLVCVAVATEKATGKQLVSPPVSLRMAVGEGWYTKDGSKWPTMTELMLRYRAASYWVSTFAPEMAMGFRTVEEQEDIEDVDYEDVSASPARLASAAHPSTSSVDDAKEKLRQRTAAPAAAPASTTTPAASQPSGSSARPSVSPAGQPTLDMP